MHVSSRYSSCLHKFLCLTKMHLTDFVKQHFRYPPHVDSSLCIVTHIMQDSIQVDIAALVRTIL